MFRRGDSSSVPYPGRFSFHDFPRISILRSVKYLGVFFWKNLSFKKILNLSLTEYLCGSVLVLIHRLRITSMQIIEYWLAMRNFISFARFILRSWRWQNGIFALQRDSLSIGSLTRSVRISFSVREAFSHRNVPLPLCFRKKKGFASLEH